MTAQDLIAFEDEVARLFESGQIRGPVHLSGGNESQLIEIFKQIPKESYIFSTWRNHYHALLAGIPKDEVMAQIKAGRSMNLCFPDHLFYTSAIVGGILPIALGVAAGLKMVSSSQKVYCFIGDMTSHTGIFAETVRYASGQELPIVFIIENNGLSTDTPTIEAWGEAKKIDVCQYHYTRTRPHVNTGKFVEFL